MMATILIVDDRPCVRAFLSEELISEGYQVVTAGDGESVKERLRFSRPDLVLLDPYPYGPEGFGVLDDIKRQGRRPTVIIFTAYDSYKDDPELSWVDGYVTKSLDLGELKQEIARVLRGASTRLVDRQGDSEWHYQAGMAN